MSNDLTIEAIEKEIEYLRRPAAHIMRSEGLRIHEQLLATMRREAKLREALQGYLDDDIVKRMPSSDERNGRMILAKQALSNEY